MQLHAVGMAPTSNQCSVPKFPMMRASLLVLRVAALSVQIHFIRAAAAVWIQHQM